MAMSGQLCDAHTVYVGGCEECKKRSREYQAMLRKTRAGSFEPCREDIECEICRPTQPKSKLSIRR
jgi:hypothetical protein